MKSLLIYYLVIIFTASFVLSNSFDDLPEELQRKILERCPLNNMPSLSQASSSVFSSLQRNTIYDQFVIEKSRQICGSINDALVSTSGSGNQRSARLLLEYGADASFRNHLALINAIKYRHFDIFWMLYNHPSAQPIPEWDCRIRSFVENGDTRIADWGSDPRAITEALENDDFYRVECLIRTMNIDSQFGGEDDNSPWIMLMKIAEKGRVDLLKLLAAKNFVSDSSNLNDIRERNLLSNPELVWNIVSLVSDVQLAYLLQKTKETELDLIDLLVKATSTRYIRNFDKSVANYMVRIGKIQVVKSFLENGLRFPELVQTAIHFRNFECLKILLEYHRQIPANAAYTAMHLGDYDAWKLLASKGYRVDIFSYAEKVNNEDLIDQINWAFWTRIFNDQESFRLLTSQSSPLYALYFAVLTNHQAAANSFISAGSNVNMFNGALVELAILHRNTDMLKLLTSHEAIIPCQEILADNDLSIARYLLTNKLINFDLLVHCYISTENDELWPLDDLLREGYRLQDPLEILVEVIPIPELFTAFFDSHQVDTEKLFDAFVEDLDSYQRVAIDNVFLCLLRSRFFESPSNLQKSAQYPLLMQSIRRYAFKN